MNSALQKVIVASLVATHLAASAAWAREESAFDAPSAITWTPLFSGVEQTELVLTKPRPLRLHALRVDLTAEGVRVVTDSDNGDRPEETDGLKTTTFLLRTGCQAAINGAPFWPGQKEEDQPQNVVGLVVSNGELVSPVDRDKPRAALVFRQDSPAVIETPPIELAGIETAVGGFGIVLQAGQVVRPKHEPDPFIDNLHPRTAVGLADEGRRLLMVVVDGRQPSYSEGVSLGELGMLLRLLGACEGLNFDGGGTTAMAVACAKSGACLVNQPIDGRVPGRQRVSASHLGVFAEPLPP